MRNGFIIAGIMGAGLLWLGGAFEPSQQSSGSKPAAVKQAANAAEAAYIGDTVTVRYPASTILCLDRDDASMVYLAGEVTMRQTLRVENSAYKAVEAQKAAQKAALAKAGSCRWAFEKGEYIVKDKQIVGDATTQFHTASYCLKPKASTDDQCWWIKASADMNRQIERAAQ